MPTPLARIIERSLVRGGLPTDDALGAVLPLFRQVASVHETGRVAPLRGLGSLHETDGAGLAFDPDGASQPRLNRAEVAAAEKAALSAVEISDGGTITHDYAGSGNSPAGAADRRARPGDDVPTDPAAPAMRIIPGWQRWEHTIGHHDELTDVGSLGELLAALLTGLDLADDDAAARLQQHQRNLFAIAPRIDPVIAAVVSSMIAPDRRRRAQDLPELIRRLETYRDQPEDFDLARVLDHARAGGQANAAADGRTAVLSHLRDRLFDLSRRNSLLHFRPTQRSINLTEASFPLVLDVNHVRPDQIFTWGGRAGDRLLHGKPVDLGSIVRWEDAPYAALALDAVISTARRDRAEYGRDQLRLVVAFLTWCDVKAFEDPKLNDAAQTTRSPLLLAPVTLTKARGVRDSYQLKLTSTEAEVNPVLRHQLRELFGFELPATLDLADTTAIETLRATIEGQARATQPGVSVTTVDKPRIELIRHRANVALQAYRRRRPSSRPAIGRRNYAYSYTWPGWSPLGLQIFADRILRQPLPLSVELGDAPAPRQSVTPGAAPIEQQTYSLREDGDGNPYAWEVDLCAVTLTNFNYRTLSLVRDYEALIAQPQTNDSFDEIFSTSPRQTALTGDAVPIADRYLVVPADDSQLAAIGQARAADNFVIQGPPGTGKSQTITNLIADYVARGQRVLFVCQKRAALDVVHARLTAQGLGEICTLVHDSQEDKKAFVHGLRETYERWLGESDPLEEVETERNSLVADTDAALSEIAGYEDALASVAGGAKVLFAVERLVALRDARWGADLTPADQAVLPEPGEWDGAREHVTRLTAALTRVLMTSSTREVGSAVFARSPLRHVQQAVFADPRADLVIAQAANAAVGALDHLMEALGDTGSLRLADVVEIERVHAVLAPLVERGRGAAIEPRSALAGELRAATGDARRLEKASAEAAAAAVGWHQPLDPDDARSALAVARRREGSVWKFLSSDWRRVRGLVADGFHAGPRAVPPTATEALSLLVRHYEAAAAVDHARAESLQVWGHENPVELAAQLELIRRETGQVAAWRDRILDPDSARGSTGPLPGRLHGRPTESPTGELDDLAVLLRAVRAALEGFVDETGTASRVSLGVLREELASLSGAAGQASVRVVAPVVRDLTAAPGGGSVYAALRRFDATPEQLEYALLESSLRRSRAAHPALETMDGARLGELIGGVARRLAGLHEANARLISARSRHWFAEVAALSQRSVTGMGEPERGVKKVWQTGRRELEHEFGKVRAYKSIRQLASGESGQVVAALRPVWLMSPSSLSDTLPLEQLFDVVIFDEASQIPVEEAVPALFRARQLIVVGDRMQLPPTQYFQARAGETNDDETATSGVVLDADSFLSVGSVRLPSTMLLWHYRSRHEALIQFSNAAFYEGRLATIPDRTRPVLRSQPLAYDVRPGSETGGPSPDEVRAAVDGIFERSICTMRMLDGVYEQRRNPAEAVWIAHLVRELLARETGRTLGIVAFSEAQQGEIERALDALAAGDADFERRYEAELTREEDGQALGLFVKNLENVQGDERDIVLMSVCYAAGPDGRMRMNFGPINTTGGERRLNVIFSRAKHHMVIVSSIDHTAITNVYNDGANALRNFLHYADAVSNGDEAASQSVLASVRARRSTSMVGTEDVPDAVAQLAAALRAAGLVVETNLGQSTFRCDLAVRRPDDDLFSVAVLVDGADRLSRYSLDERRVTQPGALRSAGWRVVHVPVTAWQENPDDVVRLVSSVSRPTAP